MLSLPGSFQAIKHPVKINETQNIYPNIGIVAKLILDFAFNLDIVWFFALFIAHKAFLVIPARKDLKRRLNFQGGIYFDNQSKYYFERSQYRLKFL